MLAPMLLAEVVFDSSTTTTNVSPVAFIITMLVSMVIGLVISVAISGLMFWKVLEKGGKPGWASLVPIYNVWLLFEMAGKPGALALILLASVIPFLGFIAVLVVWILLAVAIGKSFGKEGGFVVGLVLLGIVFYPILGFGDSKYLGPGGLGGGTQGFPVQPPQ